MSVGVVGDFFLDGFAAARNRLGSGSHHASPSGRTKGGKGLLLGSLAKLGWLVLSLFFPPYCNVPNPCACVPPPPVSKPPCVSAALFVMTLMTPFTALAPHTVPPRPRTTSIPSMSSTGTSCCSK